MGFKDISITKKLYFTVGLMALLVIVELTTLWFAVNTLSSVRASVTAGGFWAKSEKDAIKSIRKYAYTHKEAYYNDFWMFLSVPLGDHKALVELLKPKPNTEIVRKGLIEGRNHPDDVDGIIKLVMRFYNFSYFRKALDSWEAGDKALAEVIPLGKAMHKEISTGNPSKDEINILLAKIDIIDVKVSALEDDFSFTLGAGSRWMENVILRLLLIVALSVEATGLLLTFSISRSISKGLNEINRAASKIKKGDLTDRANILSKDEIGNVALAINQMTDKLVRSNEELSQFAHIASHDLQEPLRTIINFTDLLNEEHKEEFSEESYDYFMFIQGAAYRMQSLIKDLLEYSRIGTDVKRTEVDFNRLLKDLLINLKVSITESDAEISIANLPVLYVAKGFDVLFQNLISNAIKYRKNATPLKIEIGVKENESEWLFHVKDNGIGISDAYHDKIFVIFQKLHSRSEYDGSGIGLAQCKKIVELNSGHIWVESKPEEGSTFYFTVPKTLS